MYQVDLVCQALWFMARKKREVSRIFKYRTGHCFVPMANVFGLNWHWCEPSNPWRVLLPLSASFRISLKLQIAPAQFPTFVPGSESWSEKNQHNVDWSASGLWQPKAPLKKLLLFFTCQFMASVWLVCTTLLDFFFWWPIPLWNDKTLHL